MASGKIVGKTTGPSASKYDFWVEWNSTSYQQEGYSLVSATSYLQRNDGYAGSAYNHDILASNKYIVVDGVKTKSTKKGIDTRNSAKVVIASVSQQKVIHDENGYATINISSAFPRLTSNLTGGSLSKDVTLDKINKIIINISTNVTEILQNQFTVELTADQTVNVWYYSLDNGVNWIEISSSEGTSATVTISNLNDNTEYNVKFKAVNLSNEGIGTTSILIKTLPIYVTDIVLPENIYVDVGGYLDLDYTIVPENASIKTVSITSDNKNIITVDGNRLNGLVKGTSAITITANDGSGVSKTVDALVIQRVTGIYTNTNEIVVPKGSSVELKYTILPNNADIKDVEIISADETIITVEGNSVVGVENGTTTITIRTIDGGYTAEIIASVFGDYVWHDYSTPIEILNVSDIENIKSNMDTIRKLLVLNEYNVEQLVDVNEAYETQFNGVLEILQNIEYNLDILNNNDAKSIYYIEPKTVGEYGSNKDDIWRWIQVLNEMYDILTGTFGKWQYLLCADGYPTINGKKLLVRGDIIG